MADFERSERRLRAELSSGMFMVVQQVRATSPRTIAALPHVGSTEVARPAHE